MNLTSISNDKRLWTFTPNYDQLKTLKWEKDKKVWLLAYFDNLSNEDIEKVKQAAILFFRYKMPQDSAACLVDRFTEFPLD